MEMETGKLFIGGISWDTNEDRLREYFQTFGEVVEAVIMKDRTTGRARGFGFVVFSDPAVAERVVKDKHMIDGRTVEAKKAVPRDDQQILNRSNGSIQGSPGPVRTKKIFVGGLASTVTENDFKNYFDQFGIITDVVVMYDHNTQRPRGFGFITFDTEEAVDKVLLRTFHELNGKMVEVKRAVPREMSPGPNRSPLTGYTNGLSRVSSLLNAYTQGYSPSSVGGYGVRMDGRFSPVTVGRTGYPPFSPTAYNMGPTSEPAIGTNYSGNGNFSSNISHARGVNPIDNVTSNRYASSVLYGMGSGGNGSLLNSPSRNMWGSGTQNYPLNSNEFVGSGNGSNGLVSGFGGTGALWGSSPASGHTGGSSSGFSSNNNYGNRENVYGLGGGGYGRNSGTSVANAPTYATTNDIQDEDFGNFYRGGSFYTDPSWRSSSPDISLETSGLFGYGVGNGASDGMQKNSVGYVGYSVANRSNRGIAA